MFNIWIICIYIGLIFSQPTYGQSEFEVQLVVQKYVEKGSSVTLQCKHNVKPEILFKVAWLKSDQGKFFEFINGRSPPFRNFTVEGVEIDWTRSNETQVTLKNLEFEATGHYYCEVSTDTPIFTKPSQDEPLHVILPQTAPPTIRFRKKSPFLIGEKILAMCNTTRARPAPHITWLINGKKVDEKYVRTIHHSTSSSKSHRPKSHQHQPQQPQIYQAPPPSHFQPSPYQYQQPPHNIPPVDRYDKSLRIASGVSGGGGGVGGGGGGGGSPSWREEVSPHLGHHHDISHHGGGTIYNPFNQHGNPHEMSHKSYDNKYYDARKHRNSFSRKFRRYLNEGTQSHRNGNNNNGGIGASILGSQNTFAAGSGSGSGPLGAYNPVPHNYTSVHGQLSISQLNMEITDQHIGSNGRLEITCLATIPAHVGAGEQYADYKTYSLKVDVEKPETVATLPPSIGMAALGNGSFANSIHIWPIKMLILSCLSLLRV